MSGQLHAPAALPLEKSPETPWIGGWMGPKAGLEAVAMRTKALPLQGIEPHS